MNYYHGKNVSGMCAKTGTLISGIEHVRQSLDRIVLTRIGTRVQRRTFGSDLFAIVSAPGNEATRLKTVSILARAILKWEPRVKLSHITFALNSAGKSIIEIVCSYGGQSINHNVTIIGDAS
ncbi:MAG: GPW/gp25 family protein [Robiginitomaculum sp.]|nr:GPW/gp25 family protein [Robiginitomaculum sp.]